MLLYWKFKPIVEQNLIWKLIKIYLYEKCFSKYSHTKRLIRVSELNRHVNGFSKISRKISQMTRVFFIFTECSLSRKIVHDLNRFVFLSAWGNGILSTGQIKVRAPSLYSVSSRKLLAHVRLPYERKRESLSGANSLSPLPHGSPFSGRTKREGDTGKMTFSERRPSTLHSDSSIWRGWSIGRVFSLSKGWLKDDIVPWCSYLIEKFI